MRKRGVVIEISHHPVAFALSFLVLFTLTFIFLSYVGATPNPIVDDSTATMQGSGSAVSADTPESPVRIVAKDVGLDVAVVNPTSTDTTVMDDALTRGGARYPTSALLGVNGTVVIFGHSSYLPIVYHQYYKTFDGIQNLKTGAIISVYSATTEYRYSVTGVRVADSSDQNDNQIALASDAKYLTLVTCDSFATKSNRFVVTANFIGAYALAQ